MSEVLLQKNFEQIEVAIDGSDSRNITRTSLELGQLAMQFARVDRVPRYADGERESDVEHSFMLALVAPELAQSLELPLDLGLLSQFSIVHDLIELKTNDVATFLLSESELRTKEAAEAAALEQLLEELPPYTARLLEKYEQQDEPEARFVRFVDKLLPIIVDIVGDGKRVLRDDYNIRSTEELFHAHHNLHQRLERKFGDEFPEISRAHSELCRLAERLIDFDQ